MIDAINRNLRIKEVSLGALKHRKRTMKQVESMADTIILTILEKAGVTHTKNNNNRFVNT